MTRSAGVMLLVASAAALATGCGSSMTYSVDEVRRAFEGQGYELIRPSVEVLPTAPGGVFVPDDTDRLDRFLVVISSNSDADDAWPDFGLPPRDDRLDFRRANVIVISSTSLGAEDRSRVLAALASLPDRGSAITTSTQHDG